MTYSRTIAALLSVPVLGLAACGSSGGGNSDKDKIESIVKDGAKDPTTVCDHLEATVLKQLGGPAGCKKQAKTADDGDKKADIDSIDIKGDKATAKITTSKGKQTISFIKKNGDWLVTAS
ncbi:MAG: hypothetical protein JWM31_3690 [Solirubrobacterales bacterium]|nr:hypothetical protein [Solirubrobacterales bacterium]